MKPIEETFAVLALGFTIGVIAVSIVDKLSEEEIVIADREHTRADELISIYKRGMKDALRTNPVSMDLEQACLNIWANKQPLEGK